MKIIAARTGRIVRAESYSESIKCFENNQFHKIFQFDESCVAVSSEGRADAASCQKFSSFGSHSARIVRYEFGPRQLNLSLAETEALVSL